MKLAISARVTRQKRHPRGFVLRINGATLRFVRRSDAIAAAQSWADAQTVQVMTSDRWQAHLDALRAKASSRFIERHSAQREARTVSSFAAALSQKGGEW